MGIYYEYVVVHGRVLIWWIDNKNVSHSKWIEDTDAEEFLENINERDNLTQRDLGSLVKIRD